ncbi:MAG TPA: adenylate kinase [Jiangellaceae bacterium]
MRLLIMGPPGSGKGTQAAIVAKRFGMPAISTGDIFRANVAEDTPLGREADRYMRAGEYVPDEVTNQMVRDRLNEADTTDGFLLDGYPRTVAQVEFLDSVLAEQGVALDRVIEMVVDVEEVVGRLLARAAEEGRVDDTEEVIRRRQRLYATQTAPLTAVYRERGLLVQVDGMGTVDEVAARMAAALGAADE